jgi:hypothetical protein
MNEEKQAYIREVKISGQTYRELALLQERVIKIRNTFTRVLVGRKHISNGQKDTEKRLLSDYVSQEIILPIVSDQGLRGDKEYYLGWHKNSIGAIIDNCPIEWDCGKRLTVGMSQKILNLLTKDLWALDIIPSGHENFLHVVMDKIILDELGIKASWTKIDDYSDYEKLQLQFLEYANRKNRIDGTQYSAIRTENRIWLKESKEGRSRSRKQQASSGR